MELAILVRHAESEFSVREALNGDPEIPVGLTEAGRDQARRLGILLLDERIDLCVTTALARTGETADLILGDRPVPRLVVAELNDPSYGTYEGRTLAEYRVWADTADPRARPPGGGESRVAVVARYAEGLRIILGRPERRILVVAHSLPVRYTLSAAEGRGPAARSELVDYATAYRLTGRELERAAETLERWTREPVFTH